MKKVLLLALVFVLLSALVVYAQVQPTEGLIPFRGSIPDQPDGPADLRFRLFPVSSGGLFCFEETQTVQVTTAAFSVFIGEGMVGGIPPSPCFTDNTSTWIAFALDATPNAEIGGRTAMTSSGYAHFAQKVANVSIDSSNTAIGTSALLRNTTGSRNTASGANALFSNTTGFSNTASGLDALRSNTIGNLNTASGDNALFSNTSGVANTASGFQALVNNTTGDRNTASGAYVLFSNTGGVGNTASGSQALQNNDTGGGNTASGGNTLFYNTTGFFNTGIGFGALQNNTTGDRNTASGVDALFNNTGSNNTASGRSSLFSNTTGSNNTAIGSGADVFAGNLTNATAIGNGAIVDASNKIRLGNNSVTVVEGAPYSTVSDKTKKENFKPVDGEEVLKKIEQIPVNSWNFIGHDPKQFRHYGPVAQDFFAAFGNDGIGTIGTPTTITSTDMAGVLMIAVQALTKQNADLKARLEALERLVKDKPYLTASSEPVQ